MTIDQQASINLRMSLLPARWRRYCGLQDDGTVEHHGCACTGCANSYITLDEFKWWKENSTNILFDFHFKVSNWPSPAAAKIKAVKILMELNSCSAREALDKISTGFWARLPANIEGDTTDIYLTTATDHAFKFRLSHNGKEFDGPIPYLHKVTLGGEPILPKELMDALKDFSAKA